MFFFTMDIKKSEESVFLGLLKWVPCFEWGNWFPEWSAWIHEKGTWFPKMSTFFNKIEVLQKLGTPIGTEGTYFGNDKTFCFLELLGWNLKNLETWQGIIFLYSFWCESLGGNLL